jgi:dGTPase
MISRRMTHVQMVSKIARTIGRALNLNEDLIEAAALGHDLGHAPFGHEGEKCLNVLSQKYGEGFFNHNVQSVRLLMNVENNGNGKNITVQVLDAIFCHNGEMLENIYYPKKKSKEEFLKEYEISYKDQSILKKVRPMTLEGCVVRLSDIIAYIGKDVEDAVRLNLIRKEDIPSEVKEVLGTKNSTIVNTIIVDIINNSLGKNYIKMSDSIFKALKTLIDFNYKNIYLKANTDEDRQAMHNSFEKLFEIYLYQLENNKKDEDIYKLFLDYMNDNYNSNTSNIRKIIDYMSGMTDDFFLNQYKKYIQGGGYEKD